MENTNENIIKILETFKPGVDFANATDLVNSGVLDSLTIVSLILELNNSFDISITPLDIVPENFKTVDSIKNLIERLQDN
jgi:acyl carrier protein